LRVLHPINVGYVHYNIMSWQFDVVMRVYTTDDYSLVTDTDTHLELCYIKLFLYAFLVVVL